MKHVCGSWKKWFLAGTVAAMTFAGSISAMAAEAWTMENGQYVNAEGTPIVGALEKGITVTKYQNRASESAGWIDWAKVKADCVSFAMVRDVYKRQIYINAEIDDGSECAKLMEYISHTEGRNEAFKKLSDKIYYLKEEGTHTMCEAVEAYAAEVAQRALEAEKQNALEAVSYTHLDVDKRQASLRFHNHNPLPGRTRGWSPAADIRQSAAR